MNFGSCPIRRTLWHPLCCVAVTCIWRHAWCGVGNNKTIDSPGTVAGPHSGRVGVTSAALWFETCASLQRVTHGQVGRAFRVSRTPVTGDPPPLCWHGPLLLIKVRCQLCGWSWEESCAALLASPVRCGAAALPVHRLCKRQWMQRCNTTDLWDGVHLLCSTVRCCPRRPAGSHYSTQLHCQCICMVLDTGRSEHFRPP
ncbi:hypothetical protein COO60DRAFT_21075 [Scenedesmus sp. NREL 46B-D3]|nr:hypothetical protein COO60DRAFT_21075 [Scenedesmus sp. NREL 46B-D3]